MKEYPIELMEIDTEWTIFKEKYEKYSVEHQGLFLCFYDNIIEWLESKNIDCRANIRTIVTENFRIAINQYSVVFKNKSDAMLFKLTWG